MPHIADSNVMVFGLYTTEAPSLEDGSSWPLRTDPSGNLLVALADGTVANGGTSSDFGADFPLAGTALGALGGGKMVALNSDPDGNLMVAAGGGLLCHSFLSGNAVRSASVKVTPGRVYGLHFFNTTASAVFVRLYDQAGPPVNTDTPVWRGVVPPNTGPGGFQVPIERGLVFGTGIGLRVTAAVADNDNSALTANAVLGNVLFQ